MRLRAFGNYALPHRRSDACSTPRSRARATLHRRRARRPAARADAAAHLRRGRRAAASPFLDLAANQVEFAKRAAGSHRAGVRQARPEARDGDDAERVAARGAAEDPRPEDRHGHGRPTWASSCSTRPRSRSRRSPRAPAAAMAAASSAARSGLGAGVALGQVMAQPAQPGSATPRRRARRRRPRRGSACRREARRRDGDARDASAS